MRLKIQNKDVEVRVQERRIVVADFIHKGKVVASGVAIQAPQDEFNLEAGEKLAVTRAAQHMYEAELAADGVAREKIGDALKANGAISAQVELPRISMVHEMYAVIMDRLAKRRVRRAAEKAKEAATLTLEKLRGLMKSAGTGRFPSFPSLMGLPFLRSPFSPSIFLPDFQIENEDPATDDTSSCKATDPDTYFCTRPKGHPGQHIAHDDWRPEKARKLRRW